MPLDAVQSWRRAAELGAGVGAWVCGATAAAIVSGRIHQRHRQPDVTDQDLRQSEAWLDKRQHLAGVIKAVVAGPPPQAHCQGCGRGSILLGHGVAPGGVWWGG